MPFSASSSFASLGPGSMKLVVAKGHGDPFLNDITRKSLDLIRVIGEIKPLTHELIHDGQVTGSNVDLNNRLAIDRDLPRSFLDSAGNSLPTNTCRRPPLFQLKPSVSP